jgi:hypothetical protein
MEISLVDKLESGMSGAVWAGSWDAVLAAVTICTRLFTAFCMMYGLKSMVAALILYGGVAALAIVWEREFDLRFRGCLRGRFLLVIDTSADVSFLFRKSLEVASGSGPTFQAFS